MSSALRSAAVARLGTAVEVTSSSEVRLIRGFELAAHIPVEMRIGAISGVDLDGENLALTFESGERATVAIPAEQTGPSLVVRNARVARCDGTPLDPLRLSRETTVIASPTQILWIGADSDAADCGVELENVPTIEAEGRLLTPGLIDCHTHLVFAGDRADEFAMRARGADYREIAAAGGGINATLAPTRAADTGELFRLAFMRLDRAVRCGTTTIEAKTGYDLTLEGELRLLDVLGALDSITGIDIEPTLLGAHLVPPQMKDSREDYIALVCDQMIPRAAAARSASSVDVYCDEGAFSEPETRRILLAAKAAGLAVRAHVGQFADLAGAELLAELGALSADHLEEISPTGIAALAASDVIAVMLPGACVQLRQKPPPVAALREAGVSMAVASDLNPGSSFCQSLAVPMWLATTHYQMSVEEAWLGVTRNAARALGRDDIGSLAVGKAADMVLWDCDKPADVPYRFSTNLAALVIKRGNVIVKSHRG